MRTETVNNDCHVAGSDAAGKLQIASQVDTYLAWLQERMQSIELCGIERASASSPLGVPADRYCTDACTSTLARLFRS